MNFEFSDEQNMLREQARGFLAEHCPFSVTRKILDSDEPHDEALWGKVAAMGWTATVIPEAYEGLGLGYLELSVIAEELGRAHAPLPFSSSVYLASETLLQYGSEAQQRAWLPKLAAGTARGCFAHSEEAGQARPADLRTSESSGKLTGTKIAVADGGTADFAIVIAGASKGDGGSAWLVDLSTSGVTRTAVRSLDPSRALANLTLESVDAEPIGKDGEGWAITQDIFNRAAVLFAWEQTGGAEVALDMAKEYAMNRYAFGRPIATYQAIKHKLAQAYVKNTLARSNCYYGSWALATNAPELPLAAATARVAAIQAYHYAAKENIQTHGGMGFTWEFDCQFPYRRSRLLAGMIGSEVIWQEKLIAAVEAGLAA